mmetsp:Transcript_10712/g.15668  ORF Transcript_10712/g.15668 Transcript_10712/m.15668 type:complete len:209 (+) Transcript_10712:90-716(+)
MSVLIETILPKKKTEEERLREYKRSLQRSVLQLDRERNKVVNQERLLIAEMKQLAKKGQYDAVKIKAKDLIRNRKASEKFLHMKTQMQGLKVRIQIMGSSTKMVKAMAGCAKTMKKMNGTFNSESIQKIAMEFQKQGGLQKEMQDVLDEALDDVLDEDDADEEQDQLITEILDSVNIEIKKNAGVKQPSIQTISTEERFSRLKDNNDD